MTTRFNRGIVALTALIIAGLVPSASAQGSDRFAVAVIEFQRGSQVLDREYLLKDDFDELRVERAPSRLFGFTENEIRSGRPVAIDPLDELPPEPRAEETVDDTETVEILDMLTSDLMGELNLGVEESEAEVPSALEGELGRIPRPGEDLGLWGIRVHGAEEGTRVNPERLRRLREFESLILDEWIDRTLLIMEARRQGFEVTEADRAEGLYPMLLAQRARVEAAEEVGGETIVSTSDVEEIDRTITLIEREPNATASASVQRTIRSEVEAIVLEMGADPIDFFVELDEELLINMLIRDKVYEYFTEERLRAYHAENTDRFLVPPRFQFLAVKFLIPDEITRDEMEDARDEFNRLARRLRRIDEDEPLDEVIQRWNEEMADADDLPPRTYMSLSSHQDQFEIPYPILTALSDLETGETSRALEAPVGRDNMGLFIVRLVDVTPLQGREFEEVRSAVERVHFDRVEERLISALRESHEGVMGYHITRNRRGKPLSEMLARLRPDEPGDSMPDATQVLTPRN